MISFFFWESTAVIAVKEARTSVPAEMAVVAQIKQNYGVNGHVIVMTCYDTWTGDRCRKGK